MDVALACTRQKYDHSSRSTVTIIGPRNIKQLDANLASLELTLNDDQMAVLNKVSEISLGSPHEIIVASQENLFGRVTED